MFSLDQTIVPGHFHKEAVLAYQGPSAAVWPSPSSSALSKDAAPIAAQDELTTASLSVVWQIGAHQALQHER